MSVLKVIRVLPSGRVQVRDPDTSRVITLALVVDDGALKAAR